MVNVVGVRFKRSGKIYYFDPDNLDIRKNDFVIVETSRGIEFGLAVIKPKMVDESEIVPPLKKVLRVATEEDIEKFKENRKKAKEALKICNEKAKEHGLEMKLIDAEYTFDENKVIFYFTSDGRVDFRELVKDLASIFRMRIELRQIGVRDEAKMIGGLGPCGQPVCCSRFLPEFAPVSINMAKEQNLSLNPAKISGLCGRLMCCLKYEEEVYKDILEYMPEIGQIIETPSGEGVVIDRQIIKNKVKAKVKLSDGTEDLLYFDVKDIVITDKFDHNYKKAEEKIDEKIKILEE
ncbi:MAG: stage 0 sporulation family protein [Tissierellales bacterium]|nr:stage 0 sporulation family protein [Tissierellales bacterium]